MMRKQVIPFLLVMCVNLATVRASSAQAKKLPNVVILATGGTIAGVAASGTQAAYTSGAVTIDGMIAAIPDINDLANLKGEQISNVGSQDMTLAIMLTLARRINVLLAQNDVDGIVVTHGTDTMEETAYFLNLVVKSQKPVVLVGSMRPSTAVSADGPLNLYDAVAVAADPNSRSRGVLVVMNDWIHAAHSMAKTSTTAVQTFMSPLRGLVGVSSYGKNDFYNTPHWKNTVTSEFDIGGVERFPRVDILYAYADMSPDLIDASVANGAKGIVIAGVGNGNMNKASLAAAQRAAAKGIVIVRSTRVATGSVGRNVEVNDDEMNFVASDELNPQKARILLMLALLKPRSAQEIQSLFYNY
jgi:L-asparaginase